MGVYVDMARTLRSEVGRGLDGGSVVAGSVVGEEEDEELKEMLAEVQQIEARLAQIYAGGN